MVFREDFDINFLNDGRTETNLQLKTALYMYKIIFKFLLVYKKERDQERIEKLCRYVQTGADYANDIRKDTKQWETARSF